MKNLKDILVKEVEERGWSMNYLIDKIGMTKAGFYTMLDKGSTKVETLEKIAEVLELPVYSFFVDSDMVKLDDQADTYIADIMRENVNAVGTWVMLCGYITEELKQIVIDTTTSEESKSELVVKLERLLIKMEERISQRMKEIETNRTNLEKALRS
jgi:lambda repressor-like predicted transcriptional regulator